VTQLDQAQDQNQRLRGEIKLLQNEINSNKTLIERYQKEIRILEQIRETKGGQGEIAITTHEMSELLNEMRRLRQELERSIKVQNELQAKLDENLRQCRAPREIRFSGRGGVSYPDLRLIDGLGLDTSENISMSTIIDDRRSRPIGSSTDALNRHSEYEHQSLGKRYIIGELEDHERLRRLIADIKIELSQIQLKLKEKMRSKTDTNDLAWLERRSATLTQCLQRLEESYNLIEHYWKAHLPIKNKFEEHSFVDRRLADDYKELQSTNTKVLQESQQLRQKYNEQSAQMEQVLSHLTSDRH
jgi:methyl-accepting chemotaxis protein